MKKVISVFLSILIALNVICFDRKVKAENDTELYFNEDFESFHTGIEALSGYGGSANGNIWKIVEKNESKKYKMQVNTTSDMHLDKTLNKYISGNFIIQFSCIFEDANNVNRQFQIMDSDNNDIPLLLFVEDGQIITYNGEKVGNYTLNTEHTFSIAVDTSESKIKVYIDGVYKGEFDRMIKNVAKWRFHIRNIADYTTMFLDNFGIYSGKALLSNEEFANLVKERSIEFLMKDSVAMYVGKSNILLHGKKGYISENREITPIEIAGTKMIPADFFADSTGASYLFADNNVKLSKGNYSYSTQVGGNYYENNNVKIRVRQTAFLDNNVVYIPINDICDAFNMYLHTEDNGIIVYGNKNLDDVLDWKNNEKQMRKIVESYIYDDVSGDEILSAIENNYPNNAHPRLILTDEKIQIIKNEINNPMGDAVYKKLYNNLKAYADSFIDTPTATYELRDGIRLLYVCRECSDRMLSCALMYNLSGEDKYAQRAYREMEAAASFPDWNPYHFLDVGEMASCMGFAYDWLYNWMDDNQRKIIRDAMVEKAIYPIMDDFDGKPRNRSWDWRGDLADNWRFVVSGVGCSGLAFVDELSGQDLVNTKRAIIQTLIDIRESLSLFAPVGAYEEGCTYWAYSMKYLSFFSESLKTSVSNDFGYVDVPGMKFTNDYIFAINGSKNTFSYHDTGFNSDYYPPQMLFVAKYFNKINQASSRINKIMNSVVGCDDSICDILFYNISFSEATNENRLLDSYLPISEIVTMRSGYEKNDTYVGFHCDNPMGDGGGHDHMDAGQFVLDSMGENFFLDLGAENYNIEGYSDCYRLRAEGHNTIVLNPDEDYGQKYGGSAKITRYEFSDSQSFAIGDLTKAYDEEDGVIRMQRGIKLDEGRNRVIVQDEVRLSQNADFWWFAHTDAKIKISTDKKTAILSKNGKNLRARILNGANACFDVMDAVPLPTSPVVPEQNNNEGIQKLVIHVENCQSMDLTVAFTRESDTNTYNDSFIPLSKWSCDNEGFDSGILDFGNVTSVDSLQAYMASTGLIGMNDNYSSFENANSGVNNGSTIIPIVNDIDDTGYKYGNCVLLSRNSQNCALRMYFSYNSEFPCPVNGNVTTEFCAKKCDTDASTFVYEMRMKGGESEYIYKMSNDGYIYFLDNRIMAYDKDCWYDISISFAPKTKYGVLKIKKSEDDVWQSFNGYMYNDKYTNEGCERIQVGFINGNNSYVYIDNLHYFLDKSIENNNDSNFGIDYVEALSKKTESVLLDDEISLVYSNDISKLLTEENLVISLKKNDLVECNNFESEIEGDKLIIKLKDVEKSSEYVLTADGIYNESGEKSKLAKIVFNTVDFELKTTRPEINEDESVSAIVKSAYLAEKTVFLGLAVYDDKGVLKNIGFSEQKIAGEKGTLISFKPGFQLNKQITKCFVWKSKESMSPAIIE